MYCNVFIGTHNWCWIYILSLISVLTNTAFSSGAISLKWRTHLPSGEGRRFFLGREEGTVMWDLSSCCSSSLGASRSHQASRINSVQTYCHLELMLDLPQIVWTKLRRGGGCLQTRCLCFLSVSDTIYWKWEELFQNKHLWQLGRLIERFSDFISFSFLNDAFPPLANLSSIIDVMISDAEIASSRISIAGRRLFNLLWSVSWLFILLRNSYVFLVTYGTHAIWVLFSLGRTSPNVP